MSTNFTRYASYYDTLYRDKDYHQECQYIIGLFKSFCSTQVRSILDMGCGTGGHLIPLSQANYQIVGIDLSPEMLAEAARKSRNSEPTPVLLEGDIRSIRTSQTFDAVISMFAVMSYQISNEDLSAAFATARAHLDEGGIFIFDAWFGAAVLHQQPVDRIRELEVDGDRLIRLARPQIDQISHTVRVCYTILRLRGNRLVEEIKEEHPMRYLFAPEINLFAQNAGFRVLDLHPFMEPGRLPSEKDWNVTWVLRAV